MISPKMYKRRGEAGKEKKLLKIIKKLILAIAQQGLVTKHNSHPLHNFQAVQFAGTDTQTTNDSTFRAVFSTSCAIRHHHLSPL